MKLARKEVCLLDTAGAGSPVRSVTPSQLQQKKAMEKFLRDVVFECADVFLYVINDISAEEQIHLHRWVVCADVAASDLVHQWHVGPLEPPFWFVLIGVDGFSTEQLNASPRPTALGR